MFFGTDFVVVERRWNQFYCSWNRFQ